MSRSIPRSRAARIGLLAVALLHLFATAALPFTHVHEVSASVTVSPVPDQQGGGLASGHPDVCSICRTLASAQTQAPAATLVGNPYMPAVVIMGDDDTHQVAALLTTSRPRAPPRA